MTQIRIGRFSDGQETNELGREYTHIGTFAEGQAMLPDHPNRGRVGRFSDGQETMAASAAD